MRQAIEQLQLELSRRGFLKRTIQAAGIGLFWDRFGERLYGQTSTTDPKAVYSAIGNIVIPVDEDPGWITFEPGISDYALNTFVPQVLLGGGDMSKLTIQGVLATLMAFNDLPPLIGYSTAPFMGMTEALQSQYFGNILSGQFENYGVQDILFTAAFVSVFSARAVFFSNYPYHLATPGSEFQVLPAAKVRTGWDIMGFRGPVGPAEEKQLRDKYANHQVLPGVDPNNPYF